MADNDRDSRGRTGTTPLISLTKLGELHVEKKNRYGENMRYASPAQMAEFYAMHEAFPALRELAEAAAGVIESSEDEDGKRWIHLVPAGQQRLWKALSAFQEFEASRVQ